MFRYMVVRPDMPALASWVEYAKESYECGRFTNFGPLSERLEQSLLTRYGGDVETCVTANSATAALSACLVALGVTGSVLVPAFTFPASLGAIRAAGAQPLVCDVSEGDWMLSSDALEAILSEQRPSAVMIVMPFGLRYDVTRHLAIAQEQGIPVIIDNAAGLGIPRPAISAANIFEVFSLHATKPFAIGEGGAIFSHHGHRNGLKAAMNFGLNSSSVHPTWGSNGKLSEIHAAIGLAQLERFDASLQSRRAFVKAYLEALERIEGIRYPMNPAAAPWQVFPVLLESEAQVLAVQRVCADRGLEIRRYYRPSLSKWPGATLASPCPVSEDLADRMCCFPVYAHAAENEQTEVIEIVCDALAKRDAACLT